MPIRYINTPFKKYPSSSSKKVRIVIPQPEDQPVYVHGTILRKAEIIRSPWWMSIHKRGIYRPYTGKNLLESRAVSPQYIRGTLPERIVYKYLVEQLHIQPNSDFGFDFQSSLEGGRSELGGMVVDFLFESMKLIIQVQGSTHFSFLRGQKDEEQTNALAAMGYFVEEIWEEEIYDLYRFENRMREIFGLTSHGGGSYGYIASEETNITDEDIERILSQLVLMKQSLEEIYTA